MSFTDESMELKNGVKTLHAATRQDLRTWLQRNGETEKSLWLIVYHKASATPSVYYDEIVEEALCFGWIDSKPNKRDHESFYLFLAKRKPKSNWSKLNRERVARLIREKRMTPAGMKMITLAKKTGTWNALDDVDNRKIPADLQKLFAKNTKAKNNFSAFAPSAQRGILEWILNAKKPETRQRRIEETVQLAEQNIKANFPQKPKEK